MLPSFPYTAMIVTGVMHLCLGLALLINACIGISYADSGKKTFLNKLGIQRSHSSIVKVYLGGTIGCAIWFIMVGILGILAGIRTDKHQRTQGLKIAYMVTSILSAVIFAWAGLGFSFPGLVFYHTIAIVGILISLAHFLLAIVSASICCCCANTSQQTPGVVYAQGQAPPGSQPTGMYPTTNQPGAVFVQGQAPPGTQPTGMYPTTNQPPGTYPQGYYPQAPMNSNPPKY